jgi:solute carrier family 13 (sodium-dependent dicarboxylate transporter), member 2/3/5
VNDATGSLLALRVRKVGLVAGLLGASLLYLTLPVEFVDASGGTVAFNHAGRATLGMMAWMAVWWMTEAVDIEATALLPIVAFPLLGLMTLGQTTANYGADVIFLFLGGFVLALTIQRWGLDRRIAFLTLKLVGTRPGGVIAGCMGATAFMSMWVSNTATAAMMVPIALSVIDLVLLRRTGRTLQQAGGERTATTATSPWVCCCASPTRPRSAAWRR